MRLKLSEYEFHIQMALRLRFLDKLLNQHPVAEGHTDLRQREHKEMNVIILKSRGQASVEISKRTQEFSSQIAIPPPRSHSPRFCKCYSPTVVLPYNFFFEVVSYLSNVLLHIGIVLKDQRCVKWCSSTDYIIDIALSMILKSGNYMIFI